MSNCSMIRACHHCHYQGGAWRHLRRWLDCNRLDSRPEISGTEHKKGRYPARWQDACLTAMTTFQKCTSGHARNDQGKGFLLLFFRDHRHASRASLFETEPLKISDIDTLTDDYATIKIYKDTKSEYDIILGKQFMQCINRLKKGGLFDDNPILFRDNKNGNRITKNKLDGIFKRLVRDRKNRPGKKGQPLREIPDIRP